MRRKDNSSDYAYFEHLTDEQRLDHLVAYSKAIHHLKAKIQEMMLLCREHR